MNIRNMHLRGRQAFAEVLHDNTEIVISVSPDDRISNVVWPRELPAVDAGDWIGRQLGDVLLPVSVEQVRQARDAAENGQPARVQVSVPAKAGGPVLMPFTLRLTQDGYDLVGLDQGPLAQAVARADRLQVALESQLAEDRSATELRRTIMSCLRAAVVVVDVVTGRILELSRPATTMLRVSSEGHGRLPSGTAFTQCFEGRRRSEFIERLCSAATSGDSVTAELRSGRGTVRLHPDLGRVDGEMVLICHMVEAHTTMATTGFEATVGNSADGIVTLDPEGRIALANDAFLGMVGAASHGHLEGRSLAPMLQRGAIDLRTMTSPDRPATICTQLVGLTGHCLPVEITVADLPDGGHGLIARDVTLAQVTRDPVADPVPAIAPPAEAGATQQVGTVPLRDIVARTTDVIERDCIEAALRMTGDNRVAAAEMLGLSRQSLYVKLRKFGLLEKGDP